MAKSPRARGRSHRTEWTKLAPPEDLPLPEPPLGTAIASAPQKWNDEKPCSPSSTMSAVRAASIEIVGGEGANARSSGAGERLRKIHRFCRELREAARSAVSWFNRVLEHPVGTTPNSQQARTQRMPPPEVAAAG